MIKSILAALQVLSVTITRSQPQTASLKPMSSPFDLPPLDDIKAHEGLRLDAYLDGGGVPTIGYGHTKGVRMGDKITLAEAEALFLEDIAWVRSAMNRTIQVEMNPNQLAACYSLCYNIGAGAWSRSTILRKLNASDYAGAANEFKRWNKDNGKTIRGLTIRRKREAALFRKAI